MKDMANTMRGKLVLPVGTIKRLIVGKPYSPCIYLYFIHINFEHAYRTIVYEYQNEIQQDETI